ncbi:radical SAM protein [Pelosinus sp. sgz500959]|uniref:radical SAM protein n=1 Tax=Pelosinus sp. sgz500959 TaxID=3242472 RepID=UPI00366DAA04
MTFHDINFQEKKEPYALYLNFPFCKSVCSYCHYVKNIKFGYEYIPNDYILILLKQLEDVLIKLKDMNLVSIYFGGGTPSLLSVGQIQSIKKIIEKFNKNSSEISIEIHPNYWNDELVNLGFFTRFSIGVQSFDSERLTTYNRNCYNYKRVIHIIDNIRSNIKNSRINLDILFDDYVLEDDINKIISLYADTITVYPNTKGRGEERLKSVYSTLNKLKMDLVGYTPVHKAKHIFVKENSHPSLYAIHEYENAGDIIGVGHNSVSYIKDKSYLSLYDKDGYNYILRNRSSRYISAVIQGSLTGIKRELIEAVDEGMFKFFLYSQGLYYIPMNKVHSFYRYIVENFNGNQGAEFLGTIGYGDGDISTIQKVIFNDFQDDEG